MNEHKKMIDAINRIVIPVLHEYGFSGEYPTLKKKANEDRYDFVNFEKNVHGNSFHVDFSYVLLGDVENNNIGLPGYPEPVSEHDINSDFSFYSLHSIYRLKSRFGDEFFYSDVYMSRLLIWKFYEGVGSTKKLKYKPGKNETKVQIATENTFEETAREVVSHLHEGIQWLQNHPSKLEDWKFHYETKLIERKKKKIGKRVFSKAEIKKIINRIGSKGWSIRLLDTLRYLSNPEQYPILKEVIEDNNQDHRYLAYSFFRTLLENNYDSDNARYLYDRLKEESEDSIIDSVLQGIIAVDMPNDIDPKLIIQLTHNKKHKNDALRALGSFNNETSRQCLRYHLSMLDNDTNEYLLIAVISALGRVGQEQDVSLLEKYKTSRVRDVRDSTYFAINSVKNRHD